MAPLSFTAATVIRATADAVFDWHEAPGALQRLTPPWAHVHVISRTGGIRDGARVSLRVGVWPFALRWDLEHTDYQKGRSFTDHQLNGPFRSWKHVHRMIPRGEHECVVEDAIEYELPFGALGRFVGRPIMRRRLTRLFEFRHAVTRRAFEQVPR